MAMGWGNETFAKIRECVENYVWNSDLTRMNRLVRAWRHFVKWSRICAQSVWKKNPWQWKWQKIPVRRQYTAVLVIPVSEWRRCGVYSAFFNYWQIILIYGSGVCMCCALGWLSLRDCKFNSCHAIWSCRLAIFVIEPQEINKIWQLDTFQAIKFLLYPGVSQICSDKFSHWLVIWITSRKWGKAATFMYTLAQCCIVLAPSLDLK